MSDLYGLTAEQSIAQFRQDLCRANGFTEDELQFNRGGQIAPSQRARLWSSVVTAPVVIGLILLPPWILLSLWLATPNQPPRLATLLFGLSWLVSGAYLAMQVVSFVTIVRLARDLEDGLPARIDGKVTISVSSETYYRREADSNWQYFLAPHCSWTKRRYTRETYWYLVDQDRFEVPRQGYEELAPYSGTRCIVFVTPRSRLLLSLEPVQIRSAR